MKKIIKNITLGILTFGSVLMVSAQKIDSKSKTLLDAVTKNYKAQNNTYFKFVYGSGNGKVTKTEPGIFYSAGDKYKLKIMGVEQIFDGKKVYNINDEDQEVTIAEPNGSEAMFSPINYLDTYTSEYNVSYVGKKYANGVNADLIKLSPLKKNGIKNVYLFVNPAKKELIKLEQYSTDGSVSVIAIKDYKANQTLNSDMFTFNKSKYGSYLVTEL